MRIPFLDLQAAQAELRDELDAAYRRVMDGGWFILGPEVEAFEQEFAAYCGVRHCVAVGNGLEALHLILKAAGIGPGDEVVVPATTFIATWLAVSATGAVPVAAEVSEQTYTLDPASVEVVLSRRTRALLPVHLYGLPADMGALAALARRHGLLLIEDAAQAHGARCQGRRAGGLGDAAGFSFYPGKNLGAFGDGGAVTTNDVALADRVRLLRSYGARTKYQHDCIGGNSRLDELQAAFLRVRLRYLDDWNARRAARASSYRRALAGIPELVLPTVPGWAEPAWHLFVIRHPRRDELQQHLGRAGIGTLIHYPVPPHCTGAYRQSAWRGPDLSRSEHLATELLSVPLGPHLAETEVYQVADAIAAFARGLRKAG